jgi:hypothetical protein
VAEVVHQRRRVVAGPVEALGRRVAEHVEVRLALRVHRLRPLGPLEREHAAERRDRPEVARPLGRVEHRALAAHRQPRDRVPAASGPHGEASLDQLGQLAQVVALPARAARAGAPPVRVPATRALGHHDDPGEALRDLRDVAALGVGPVVVRVAVPVQQVEHRPALALGVAVGEQHVHAQRVRPLGRVRRRAVELHLGRVDELARRGQRDQLRRVGGSGREQRREDGRDYP